MSTKYFIIAAGILCFSVLFTIWWNMTVRQEVANNWETYTSSLHTQVLHCIEASSMTDPFLALTKVIEAKAIVMTLCKLVGGEEVLTSMTRIDVSEILNTLYFQERQIRQLIPLSHPLYKYICDVKN